MEAYARRLGAGDREDRLLAAHAWNDWEGAHISLDPNSMPIDQGFDEGRGLAILVTHYRSHDGFLRDGKEILRRVSTIGHIPVVLIHGRRDVSGPAITAWRLHQLWPASTPVHRGIRRAWRPLSIEEMRIALDAFA